MGAILLNMVQMAC